MISLEKSSPEERQALLLEQVNANGRVLASVVAQEFGVSEDSIRRDLKSLVDAGLVQRFHGGAMRLTTPPLDFRRREAVDEAEKAQIGRNAAETIEDGSTLLVDSSTTVLHFLRSLRPGISVRIVTTAVDVAATALDLPGAEVTILGGRLNRFTRSSIGALALDAVRSIRADICILGTCGIDEGLVVRADDIEDAFLKSAMIEVSTKTIMLATDDKIGRSAAYAVAPVSKISSLFTTTETGPLQDLIKEQGVEIIGAAGLARIR